MDPVMIALCCFGCFVAGMFVEHKVTSTELVIDPAGYTTQLERELVKERSDRILLEIELERMQRAVSMPQKEELL
jgi:hypothetical protein